jgi:hypothetical protein
MTAGRVAMAKKNKKKQKAKTAQANNHSNNNPSTRQEEEEEEEVHTSTNGPSAVYTNTGLSPELESVHLRTTASLNPKNPNNNINADINQLMATAHHLYQQSSLGHFRETDIGAFPSAEEYWASLPDKVQNLIRQASNNLTGSPAERQEALMAIMTSMAKGGRIPGGFPLPDAQALLGLDLSQSQAELAAKLGVPNAMYHQDGEYNHGYTNGAEEDDYGTEDEEYYPEEQEPAQHPGTAGGKKKNRKKKKRSLGYTQSEIPVSYNLN